MLTNQSIKLIRSLALKKNRNKHRLFVVEGEKGVNEFLNSEWEIEALYANNQWSGSGAIRISNNDLERMSSLKSPNKVLAVVKMKSSVSDIKGDTILALEGVSDPGNLGTIIRLADWFGVSHICCSPDVVDCFNPKVVQASMGSMARVDLHYHNLIEKLSKLKGYDIFSTVLDGEPISKLSKSSKKVILFGNESQGISTELLSISNYKVSIPKHTQSKAESLNVAIACGICLSTIIYQ